MATIQLSERVESILGSLQEFRDDVLQAAGEATISEQDEHAEAYKDIKKRIDNERTAFEEIAGLIRRLEAGEVPTQTPFKNGRSPLAREEFRKPFLDALRELGGQARLKDIMARVEPKMRSFLSAADYEHDTPSDPDRPRWKATLYGLTNELKDERKIVTVSKGTYRLAK